MLRNTAAMQLEHAGHPLHTRALSVTLTQRTDGRIDFDSYVLDLRKRGFVPVGGDLQGPGIIHHMCLRGIVSSDWLHIDTITAGQPSVAFEATALTTGESCRDPIDRIAELSGTRLDAEYTARLSAAIGGPRGCSHLLTLAHLVGSTIPWAARVDRECHSATSLRRDDERIFRRDLIVDGAEVDSARINVAVQLTDLLWAPTPAIAPPMARFAAELEIRLQIGIDRKTYTLADITGARRRRRRHDLADAAWDDVGHLVNDLVGLPMFQGVSAQLRSRFDARPDERPLQDALLMVAPTLIQCSAALSESWALLANNTTSVVGMGGIPDSCYMWRRDGALHKSRRPDDPTPRP
jgi:hypothetical protein